MNTPTQRLNEIAGRLKNRRIDDREFYFDDVTWLLEEVRVYREALEASKNLGIFKPNDFRCKSEKSELVALAFDLAKSALEGERR